MNAARPACPEATPDYVAASVGDPDLQSIANRLRDLAALLAAQDLLDVAGHVTEAYGTLLARITTRSRLTESSTPEA